MAEQLRRRDPMRAAVWAGFGLAFASIGATMTYPHPWFSPETTVAIAAVSFAAAAVCFARAVWYGLVGIPALKEVSYRQFQQTRDKQEKQIASQSAKIEELQSANSELARIAEDQKRRLSLVEAIERDAPRQLSATAREIIAGQLKGIVREWQTVHGRKPGVAIYYQPGRDCASYAQEFSDLLGSLGVQVFCSVLRPEYVADGDTTHHGIGIFVIDGPRPTFGDWLHEAMADAGISSQRLLQEGGGCVLIIGAKADG